MASVATVGSSSAGLNASSQTLWTTKLSTKSFTRKRPVTVSLGEPTSPACGWIGGSLTSVTPAVETIGPNAGWLHKGLTQKADYGQSPGAWRFVEASTSLLAKSGPVERSRVGRYGPAKAVTPPHVDLNVEELSTRLRRVSPHANLVPAAFMDRMNPYNPEDVHDHDTSSASAASEADGLSPQLQAMELRKKSNQPPIHALSSGTVTPRIVSKEASSELRGTTAPFLSILEQATTDDFDDEVLTSDAGTPPAVTGGFGESRRKLEVVPPSPEASPHSRVVSLRMHRFAMTRGLRSRTRKMREKMQKEFEDLPVEAKAPLEAAIARCAVGNPPVLTANGALRCAAELGVVGHCEDLHRKFWQLSVDRAEESGSAVAGSEVSMVSIAAGTVRMGNGDPVDSQSLEHWEAAGTSPAPSAAAAKGIPLVDFAMGLLPQMRDEMLEQYTQDFRTQYTNIIGGDAPETFQLVAVLEIARRLGFDRTHFGAAVESLRLEDEVHPLNAKLMSSASSTRSGRVPPSLAAQAAVICTGQASCGTLQRATPIRSSLDVKGWRRLHAGMGMPKLELGMQSDLVDLHDHFQSLAQDGTISSSEAYCILGSLGFMSAHAVQDSEPSPSERHDLTSFIRQASFAEDRLRKQSMNMVAAIFQVRLQPGRTELPTSEVGHLLNDIGLLPSCHEEQVLIREVVSELRARTNGSFDVLWFQSLCTAVEKCLLRAQWDAMVDQVLTNSFGKNHSAQDVPLHRGAHAFRMPSKEVPPMPHLSMVPAGGLPFTFSTPPSGSWLTPIIIRHALRWLQVPAKVSRCLRNEELGPVLVKHLTLRRKNTEACWTKTLEKDFHIHSLSALWHQTHLVVEKAVQARELALHHS